MDSNPQLNSSIIKAAEDGRPRIVKCKGLWRGIAENGKAWERGWEEPMWRNKATHPQLQETVTHFKRKWLSQTLS